MGRRAPFHIGDTVVYPMHGLGCVDSILTLERGDERQPHYRLILQSESGGDVLVPVAHARELGLRRALRASQVPQVIEQLVKASSRSLRQHQGESHYQWCKARLRQGGVLGLAEVERFLYDLERREPIANYHLLHLRHYVRKQLPIEIARALRCSYDNAAHLVHTLLHHQDKGCDTRRV
jgi:CarD family transcriptional regulator, regulator of rRNA transcription